MAVASSPNGPALLYVAHRLDPDVLAGWRVLYQSCAGAGFHPIFLYDNSRGDFEKAPELEGADVWLFTFAELSSQFPFKVYDPQRRLDQGNTTFPIIWFFRANPDYPAYWRIEYDVVYDGEWHDFFSAYTANPADLLTTTLYRPEVRPDWGWWPTIAKPWHVWRPLRRVRAFMPIARLSPRALTTIDKAYQKGWVGHDEVLVPSVLQTYGLTIQDLGGEGEFTPENARERLYTNTPAARGLAPGSFVCPPHLPTPDPRPGMLYHPVKDRTAWDRRRRSASPQPASD